MSGRQKTPKRSRGDWLAAAVHALGTGGVEAVRVEALARALGVTKGSFYWHFKDRPELLDAVLGHWERAGTDGVIEAIDGSGGSPEQQLRNLWKLTSSDENFSAELALRDWARRDDAVAERVRAVDDRRMQYLRKLLRAMGCKPSDAERRAMLMYSLLIGNHFIAASHGRRSRTKVLADALELLFEVPG